MKAPSWKGLERGALASSEEVGAHPAGLPSLHLGSEPEGAPAIVYDVDGSHPQYGASILARVTVPA